MSDNSALDSLLNANEVVDTSGNVAPADTAEPTVGATGGKTDLIKEGAKIYRNLSAEEKSQLSANSGKVHFICVLGTHSMPMPRTESDKNGGSGATVTLDSYVVVGYKFKTDIEITVPEIKFLKPPYDVRTAPTEIGKRVIPAGSEFVLTRVEAMYMLTDPALALNGYCEAFGDAQGVQLCAKVSTLEPSKTRKANAIPTPALRYTNSENGSIKVGMAFIDDENKVLLPEYAEKFADITVSRQAVRGSGTGVSKAKSGNLTSLALAKILGM